MKCKLTIAWIIIFLIGCSGGKSRVVDPPAAQNITLPSGLPQQQAYATQANQQLSFQDCIRFCSSGQTRGAFSQDCQRRCSNVLSWPAVDASFRYELLYGRNSSRASTPGVGSVSNPSYFRPEFRSQTLQTALGGDPYYRSFESLGYPRNQFDTANFLICQGYIQSLDDLAYKLEQQGYEDDEVFVTIPQQPRRHDDLGMQGLSRRPKLQLRLPSFKSFATNLLNSALGGLVGIANTGSRIVQFGMDSAIRSANRAPGYLNKSMALSGISNAARGLNARSYYPRGYPVCQDQHFKKHPDYCWICKCQQVPNPYSRR